MFVDFCLSAGHSSNYTKCFWSHLTDHLSGSARGTSPVSPRAVIAAATAVIAVAMTAMALPVLLSLKAYSCALFALNMCRISSISAESAADPADQGQHLPMRHQQAIQHFYIEIRMLQDADHSQKGGWEAAKTTMR